jgi:hypothetical protein
LFLELTFLKMANTGGHTHAVELDENAVPGTVHIIDIEGTLRAKHAGGANADVVLVPAPSNDPDDPLNWSPRRKLLSTFCMSTYTLVLPSLPSRDVVH